MATAALALLAACGKDAGEPIQDPAAASAPRESAQAAPAPDEATLEQAESEREGLHVDLIQAGAGPVARTGSRVAIRYRACVKDATAPFDASEPGQPLELTLGGAPRVIEGLARGLEGLRQGSRARLTIPSALAWGAAGNPAAGVPENADVVYEVELVRVH